MCHLNLNLTPRSSFGHFVHPFWNPVRKDQFLDNWTISDRSENHDPKARTQTGPQNYRPRTGPFYIGPINFEPWTWPNRIRTKTCILPNMSGPDQIAEAVQIGTLGLDFGPNFIWSSSWSEVIPILNGPVRGRRFWPLTQRFSPCPYFWSVITGPIRKFGYLKLIRVQLYSRNHKCLS